MDRRMHLGRRNLAVLPATAMALALVLLSPYQAVQAQAGKQSGGEADGRRVVLKLLKPDGKTATLTGLNGMAMSVSFDNEHYNLTPSIDNAGQVHILLSKIDPDNLSFSEPGSENLEVIDLDLTLPKAATTVALPFKILLDRVVPAVKKHNGDLAEHNGVDAAEKP